jgi:hypothetical protein
MNPKLPRLSVLACLAVTAVLPSLRGDEESLISAVYSRVHNNYSRSKNADGTYRHQPYVVAKGGFDPGLLRDPSIDPVPFSGIMRTMAPYLAKQNYLPAREGKNADLMLVVYWGTTKPFDNSQYNEFGRQAATALSGLQGAQRTAEVGPYRPWGPRPSFNDEQTTQQQVEIDETMLGVAASQTEDMLIQLNLANTGRDKANERNANLLGYVDEINLRNGIARYGAGAAGYNDLISDLEEPRYYVVIGAYDFQEALQHNRKKLLWSTRVSIRAAGNRFDERLAAMLANASRYFGQESGRLIRRYERVPRVDFGELKSLGLVTEASFQKK